MRYSLRIFIIALPAALCLFLWIASPVLAQTTDAINTGNTKIMVIAGQIQETHSANDTPEPNREPTRAPRPTPTPIPVPPPTSQNTIQMLVVSGVLVVAVVIFGLWLNRKRLF